MSDKKIIEKLAALEKTFACWMESYCAMGPTSVDTKEAGDVADILKDLAEAKEKCLKAVYYEEITKAMKQGHFDDIFEDDMDEAERMGYDNYRYKTSGHYAPKGHGTYVGRHGYSGGGSSGGSSGSGRSGNSGSSSSNGGGRMGYTPEYDEEANEAMNYGMPYGRYTMAKRGYQQTGNKEHKREMDAAADEHLHKTVETMKEMWNDSDPTLKSKMTMELKKLLSEFNNES